MIWTPQMTSRDLVLMAGITAAVAAVDNPLRIDAGNGRVALQVGRDANTRACAERNGKGYGSPMSGLSSEHLLAARIGSTPAARRMAMDGEEYLALAISGITALMITIAVVYAVH
jgi:hypothetical protein